MSVLIRGMSTPTMSDYSKRYNTPEISRFNGSIIVYPDDKVALRVLFGQFKGVYEIAVVPPHGRLIDADQFECVSFAETEGWEDTFEAGVQWILEKLDAAPTIIEADRGDDE